MMVSKVAVIALVAIVACPILLGYGLNLNEVTITDYEISDDSVNVTPLLQTGTDWSMAYGDPYQLNNAGSGTFSFDNRASLYPIYNKISTQKTTQRLYAYLLNNYIGGEENNLQSLTHYQMQFDYTYNASQYVSAVLYDNGEYLDTITQIVYFSWDGITGDFSYLKRNSPTSDWSNTLHYPNLSKVEFTLTGFATIPQAYMLASAKEGVDWGTPTNQYADLSEGYYFKKYSGYPMSGWNLGLPEDTISAVLTVNLDSITDSSYSVSIEGISLTKTTTDGVVSWKVGGGWYGGQPQDLYYNPNISNNTYQILLTDLGQQTMHGYTGYWGHAQFRYVGTWQKVIGVANYYQAYEVDYYSSNIPTLDDIKITSASYTPTIRMDAAQFRAFEYQVIENNTYDPADFRSNPATTLNNINQYGSQIIFGGNTYNVSNGNITIGSHKIPLNGAVFESVPNSDTLDYDNRINGTVVSTTAQPSTIQFVGKWSASVSTASMQSYSYTKTEWTPGEFGWNGIDQNFLMVGLLTSIGVFIALGIYIRRTKAALWPLLIVCGGAAMLFFCML